MTRTRIKVCGITNAEDAAAAVAAGADALGVILAPSPRQVTTAQAAQALAAVPPGVTRIGVFVDADADAIQEAVTTCGLHALQFSGHESAEQCQAAPLPVVKMIPIGTDFGVEAAEPFRGHVAALLLDTFVPGKAGGTSQTFDWRFLDGHTGWAPLFVAGGLTPENVGACVRALRPYAVDVSSGVERAPGVKDHQKLLAFCAAVTAADLEVGQ